jgi:DNA-binding beta-propeller fold protein YncE
MGLLALSLTGCGNRFASVNYSNLANYARPVRPAEVVKTQSIPNVDIGRPVAMTFDKADNLLVANNKGGSILAVTSRGEAMEKADNLPDPSSMAVGRNGSIYIACFKDGSIVRMNNQEIRRTVKGLAGPRSVAVTSDETLYVTLPESREIVAIKPDGTRQTVWTHASFVPELILTTGQDELFVSVQDGRRGRLLQLTRQGKQIDEYTFDNHVTGLAADAKGRLLVAAAAMDEDGQTVGELGWLDRDGAWAILAEDVARPMAVAVSPGGFPVYVQYDGKTNRYQVVTIIGDASAPWLSAS